MARVSTTTAVLQSRPRNSSGYYGTFADDSRYSGPPEIRSAHPRAVSAEQGLPTLQEGQASRFEAETSLHAFEAPPISYARLLRTFSIVPILSLLEFTIFILLLLIHPHPGIHHPDLMAFFLSLALWSLTHQLGIPVFHFFDMIYSFSGYDELPEGLVETLSTITHVAFRESGRLFTAMLLVSMRTAKLRDILWASAGWAMGEVCCGMYQSYHNLSQYRDVLPLSDYSSKARGHWFGEEEGEAVHTDGTLIPISTGRGVSDDNEEAEESGYEDDLQNELTALVALKARLELEQIYGMPFPNIPPILIVLQWLNSLLLTTGLTLVISHSYIAHHAIETTLSTLAATWAVHSVIALVYGMCMPKIGVHAVNYFGLLVGISTLFVGLAQWGVLE